MARTAQGSIDYNRREKARKIYDALRSNGIEYRHFRTFTPPSWGLAAQMAGYKDGKVSPETRGLVAELFESPASDRSLRA